MAITKSEVEFVAIRSQGPGGQNVNKVSTAVQLRFDIEKSNLSDKIKAKLLQTSDHRITTDGIILIKSQQHRSQEKNKIAALSRLNEMIAQASLVEKKRTATTSTYGSKQKRMDKKTQRGQTKSLRGRIDY